MINEARTIPVVMRLGDFFWKPSMINFASTALTLTSNSWFGDRIHDSVEAGGQAPRQTLFISSRET